MNQLENVKSEEWRPIKEHEGLYDISSCARELKISKGSICEQLKGRRKSVAGYTFNYK